MPTLTSPGVGSGLDISGIVQKLMQVEQQPLNQLDAKTAADQAKISAYGSLKGSLSALQAALQGLATAGSFGALAATVADDSVLGASVGSGAVAGTYGIEVSKLAQAHKLASGAFTSSTDAVGTGTLTFDFGTFAAGTFTSNGGGAKSVVIGAGQGTLAGIRDAVNAASIGVTATIVNDGNTPGTRIVFTSNATGAANSLKVTVADGDGNATDTSGLSQLAYDPAGAAGSGQNLEQKVAAQDALLTIDGIAVHAASNDIDNAIDGITLHLAKTNVGAPTVLDVAADTAGVGKSVAAFVKGYNDLHTTFNNLTRYDATKKQASVLTGDGTVRMVQNQLRSLLGGAIGSGSYSMLSQVGITFQTDGTLALDASKLNAALAANPGGVTQLFAAMGTASDSLVSVTGFGSKSTPGTYALAVTQLATQGTLVGQGAAGLVVTAGVDDSLGVVVDGVAATVTLAPGTYASADALAAEIQAKANGASALAQAGSRVTVSASGGVLTMTSARYGSASFVNASGTAAAGCFGAAPAATNGLDAAGTLDGSPLTGAGRSLNGVAGTALEGLQVDVAGGALGARGTVTYQTGFAYRMNDLLKNVLGSDGAVAARTDGLQKDIGDIAKRRDALSTRLAQVQAQYLAQFNALDTLLSQLGTQSSALAQQLANLPKTTGA